MSAYLNRIFSTIPLVNYRETHDFDEQAEMLKGWNQDYLQISSGHYSGYVSDIRFERVHMFLEYTSKALFQQGCLDEESIAVGVPMFANSTGVFCGSATGRDYVHVFSGREGFEFYSPSELLMAGITVQRAELMQVLTPDEQESLDKSCAAAHVFSLETEGLEAIRRFVAQVFVTVGEQPEVMQGGAVAADFKQTLLALLAETIPHINDKSSTTLAASRCWKIIAETQEMVREQTETPLSVTDLCLHFGVSRRMLQNCFQNMLAISPAAYLRAERLNAVRRMLKETDSVTEAAANWGFWHFGHFSQEYKKLFGELPSATLKRAHADQSGLVDPDRAILTV